MRAPSFRNFLFIVIITLFLVYLILFPKYDETNVRSSSNGKLVSSKSRHVFIDLGGNIGDSVKYFVNKDSATDGIKGYAARDESIKWEIHVVEANPFFNNHLDELKVYCEKLGHTIYVYKETAAWVKNEKLIFFLDTVNPGHNYWGSSLLKGGEDVKKSNFKNVTVNGIDISDMLSKYNSNDEVILKVDIEGTEYELLEHLVKTDTLRLVDVIAVEFHNRLFNDKTYSETETFMMKYFKLFNIKFITWG